MYLNEKKSTWMKADFNLIDLPTSRITMVSLLYCNLEKSGSESNVGLLSSTKLFDVCFVGNRCI